LTFNAQFNFCYPQPFQAFDHSKNFGTKLSKISPFIRPGWQPDFSDRSPTFQKSHLPCRKLRLSPLGFWPWRDEQLSGFFSAVNQIFRFFSAASFPSVIHSLAG